jgi:hypothetical protein
MGPVLHSLHKGYDDDETSLLEAATRRQNLPGRRTRSGDSTGPHGTGDSTFHRRRSRLTLVGPVA